MASCPLICRATLANITVPVGIFIEFRTVLSTISLKKAAMARFTNGRWRTVSYGLGNEGWQQEENNHSEDEKEEEEQLFIEKGSSGKYGVVT